MDEEELIKGSAVVKNSINVVEEEDAVSVRVTHSCCKKFYTSVDPLVCTLFFSEALSASVLPNFILKRTCESYFHYNQSVCSELEDNVKNATNIESEIQPYAAVILTGMNFLSTLIPAIMSLFLGPWSDYNGRKLLIIAPSIGFFLKYLLLAVLSCLPNVHPFFGLLAVIPIALCGGIVNFITAVYSYASDITTEENRSFRISILESFMYCGSLVGLLSSSYIYNAGGSHGYLLIFGLCSSVIFISTTITYFFLSESVQRTEDGKGVRRLFELKLIKEMFRVCFKKRERHKRAIIFLVIISLTLAIVAMEGEANVMFLYTRLRFGWNIQEFTFWNSATLALSFAGLLFGSILLTKWLKLSDACVGAISFMTKAGGIFYLAFIPPNAPKMMYYVGLISFLGGLNGPAGRAVLSKNVPKEDLGKVFALTGSSESIFPLAFSPLYTLLYNSTINTLPSAFLLLTGSFFIICIIIYVVIYIIQKQEREIQYEEVENHIEA